MSHYKQARVLFKLRTIMLIILAAFIFSVLYTLAFPQRTHALLLETLQDATTAVKQIVSPVFSPLIGTPKSVLPVASTSSSDQKTATAPLSTPPAQSKPTDSGLVVSSEPLAQAQLVPKSDLPTIYFSKAKMPESLAGARRAAIIRDSVSSSSFAWLQPTNRGWKVLGILWYWWVINTVTVVIGVILWRRGAEHYIASKWLLIQSMRYVE